MLALANKLGGAHLDRKPPQTLEQAMSAMQMIVQRGPDTEPETTALLYVAVHEVAVAALNSVPTYLEYLVLGPQGTLYQ